MTDSILRHVESNIDEISLWHGGRAYRDLISLSSDFADLSNRLIPSSLDNSSPDDLKRLKHLHTVLTSHIAAIRLVGHFIDEPHFV